MEWKPIKVNKKIPIQHNGKTYYWYLNHNYGNDMWMVHLLNEYKASYKSNARFQNTPKSENKKQTAEPGKLCLKLSENLQASLMSDMQLSRNEVDQNISSHYHIHTPQKHSSPHKSFCHHIKNISSLNISNYQVHNIKLRISI